ncbi:MAG: hypothetical protein O7D30_12640, partial [Rickettsia endosymbiont of Ixodes persulcatus]|nr:hypothetical protein [Rickettsia endosymbiont of Ixodes persulcatus]
IDKMFKSCCVDYPWRTYFGRPSLACIGQKFCVSARNELGPNQTVRALSATKNMAAPTAY